MDPAFAREFQESTLARPIPPAQLDTFVAESLKVPARVWQATFREFIDTDFSADLGRITAPSLIVWGEKDSFVTRQERDRHAAAMPAARVVDYAGYGHAMHWEDPARFAADIARFVGQLPGGGPNLGRGRASMNLALERATVTRLRLPTGVTLESHRARPAGRRAGVCCSTE